MGLFPVTVSVFLLINHADGQPYMFWRNLGGGHVLTSREDVRVQIGHAAKEIGREELVGNTDSYVLARASVSPESYTVKDVVKKNGERHLHDRPSSLRGKKPNMKLDMRELRD
jgi:hypothetical protein